jgi:lysophospholipase L1-like esterase
VKKTIPLGFVRNTIFSLAMLALIGFSLETISAFVLKQYPDIETTRQYLLGEQQFQLEMNSVSQAYLLYIPAPNYVTPWNNVKQNNAEGYRGESIPLQRSPDSLRILFLGGSTTYGEGVPHPEDAFPAQVGKLLREDSRFAGKRIEIINAGLRFGSTAEILTHYLLKFRYYRPDMVVINPGGNDPVAYMIHEYEPDYSNWRKSAPGLPPLKKHARWILKSRALSIAVVLLFFPDYAIGQAFAHAGEATPAFWFHPREKERLHIDELAFHNNLVSVIREIKNDGADVFLVSYQGNPFDKDDQKTFRRLYDYEETVLGFIGKELSVPYAPFPLDQMPENLWVDASHINEEGERRKARYVFDRIVDSLASRAQHNTVPVLPENAPVLDLPTWSERYHPGQ